MWRDVLPSCLNRYFLSCIAMYVFEQLAYPTGRKNKTFRSKGRSVGICISAESCLREPETDSNVQKKGLIGRMLRKAQG